MIKKLSFKTHEIAEYISWTYFFHAWGISAKFATIAKIHDCQACTSSWINSFTAKEDKMQAKEAINLYKDAIEILNEVDGKYDFHGCFGIFEANSAGDDILVYSGKEVVAIPCLRQQNSMSAQGECLCLADFIIPKEMGKHDKIGVFVSSNAKEMENLYPSDNYKHMLCQVLSDRLAEAGTELMHAMIRRRYWGFSANENLSTQEILQGKYQGIRPAVGYPSFPDQSVIFILDKLIDFSQIGVTITETGSMSPHASTCGLIFAHPKARYFNIGKIDQDQLNDYSARRDIPIEQVEDYLRANLV